jgi:uncharacterized protein
MTHMVRRILSNLIEKLPKGLILLGPRQVGKSTLAKGLGADLQINLADEETYQKHLKDPGLIKRIVNAEDKKALVVFIDEIQRIPSMLNTIQALIDENKSRRFVLTGSSARKLKRGQANLLPGRIFWKHLSPFLFWEIEDQFDLKKALITGTLPEVYLEDYGRELLKSYTSTYLREEIQAEALTKDLASYARFLDLAAELSGQYINYSKIASDSEINKETIRRYFDILVDTLIVEKVKSYTQVSKERKARQKERFIFFDLGVRNAILKRETSNFSKEEMGFLFEQWITLQVIYLNRTMDLDWEITSYRDDRGLEVDLIIEDKIELTSVEIKSSQRVDVKMTKNLVRFEKIIGKKTSKIIVYQGDETQNFDNGCKVFPYKKFLNDLLTKAKS